MEDVAPNSHESPSPMPGSFQENVLPIGVRQQEGPRIREYSLREHTGKDLNLISDRKLRNRSPAGWLARVVAVNLATLGDQDIYSQYKGAEYKSPPSILNRMPVADVEYIMIVGHIHSYGMVTSSMFRCPHCDSEFENEFELTDIDVTKFPNQDYRAELRVVLENGVRYDLPKDSLSNKKWTQFFLRPPELGDLQEAQRVRARTGQIEDYETLVRSITSVRAGDGTELPPKMKDWLGSDLINEMKAPQVLQISDAINDDFPHVDRQLTVRCEVCGRESADGLDPTSLLPGG